MKDKFYEMLENGTTYQFIVLIALIVFNAIYLCMTKTLEPTITGAIIGLAVGLPINQNNKTDK